MKERLLRCSNCRPNASASGHWRRAASVPKTRMYSAEWFDTFAATVPASISDLEIEGIASVLPVDRYRRVLDIGCGIGRIASPLAQRGYAVTGIDVNVDALRQAQRTSVRPRYVALDQQHIGRMRWVFDAALVLWNSLGFANRAADGETLAGCAAALRPGGKLILDLYHPAWMKRHEMTGERDPRGATVRRWVEGNRCLHEIQYASGRVDTIQFSLYDPNDIRTLLRQSGLEPIVTMASWNAASPPHPDLPRYQLVSVRP